MLKKLTRCLWGLLLIPLLLWAASDNFTRANSGDLGPDWAYQTGAQFGIVSNSAAPQNGFNPTVAYFIGTFSDDQYSQGVISGFGGATEIGLVVRASDSANTCYAFITNGTNAIIRKIIAGSESTIESITGTFTPGDEIRISAVGTTITVYQNDVEVGSATDSDITSGNPGLFGYGNDGRINTWEGNGISPPPGGVGGSMFLIF